ncbi:MAG: hypothetical protein M0R66_04965, partial [Candidatus Omnitrophica bacterium]|nr:hypothetical protein [Candidatus Omnitrophota bacterium]
MSRKEHPLTTNIEDYVRAEYPKLAQLLDYCQLMKLLEAHPNSRGVTLIIPSPATIDMLAKESFSNDVSTINDTCNAILAHVIRGALKLPVDWTANDIADKRTPSQRVHGEPKNEKNVELLHNGTNYATIAIDPKFVVGFRTNLAVWKITTGAMRTEMDAPASIKGRGLSRAARSKSAARTGGVSGGYVISPEHAASDRSKIAIACENEFVAQYHKRATDPAPQFEPTCPFIAYVASFARFVFDRYADEFYCCILPLIRFRAVDFYTIFEPHRAPEQRSDYLIDDRLISEWWASFRYQRFIQTDVLEFRKWIDERLTSAHSHPKCDAYAIYYDRAASSTPASDRATTIAEAIDAARLLLLEDLNSPFTSAEAVCREYDKFSRANAIGDPSGAHVKDVYPPPLAEYYKTHLGFKQIHDELAFVIEPIMIRLRAQFDMMMFQQVIMIIGNAMHARTPEDVKRYMPLSNAKRVQIQVEPMAAEIKTFVKSTMFFWVPQTTTEMKNYPIESSPQRPITDDITVYNTDLALALHHERVYSGQSEHIADATRMIALKALEQIP